MREGERERERAVASIMRRQETGQVTVAVGVKILWKALTKDLNSLLPTVVPTLIIEAEILQGDGGFDTIHHFKFSPGVTNMSYQKEKVVDLDESIHRIGLQVIEGGRLDLGFSFYKNSFQLTAMGDSETLVDVEVDYETEWQDKEVRPGEAVEPGVDFIRSLESFLLKQGSQTFP